MKMVIKATIAAAVMAIAHNALAKDGDFTGNVKFEEAVVNSECYQKTAVTEKTQPSAHLTFAEKLSSAADK
ncbi:hypothetical protein [Aliivibrio fischeri]|uniref:hypothetical protein n=1 Tax=Aliivibrio fischeri TaxID=668 RepID=UPI0012DA7C97|nr:hypothetical protein [Aliivibrio fischeri]MUL09644.1 hypothetical protein [Aliivibrio fischeri]MUL14365.1 hypothetical protein [Aliivibrio fischeri]